MTIASLILYGLVGLFLTLVYLAAGPIGWMLLGATVTMMFCALMAICQPKPAWMQIYWVVSLPMTVFLLLIYLIQAIIFTLQYIQATSRNLPQDKQTEALDALIGSIVSLILLAVISVWALRLTWSYYCYLRDKQLYDEQHGNGNVNVVVYNNQQQPQQGKF
ncbi:unnamed protein product, partial [Mesorhabditis belari]|uniref:Uncharacterized protein n=1 Tax=Mesorhabditis belari TaxID=2138241 RepID=A0AAF3EV05_9BILA